MNRNCQNNHIPSSIAAILAAMLFCSISVSCQTANRVSLHFYHIAGGRPLVFDSILYKNGSGQSYSVTMLKYYISNIKLRGIDRKIYENPNGYFLIDSYDPSASEIVLADLPAGDYDSLSFIVGVDSLHNCSGAQEGALDPANGMFWAWNTGYIFLKMEGKSTVSKSPGHIYEYHIGGYKEPSNCIRKVSIALTSSIASSEISERSKANKDRTKRQLTDININVNVEKLLNSKSEIDISKLSSVTDFHNATTIADNYQKMFSLGNLRYGH